MLFISLSGTHLFSFVQSEYHLSQSVMVTNEKKGTKSTESDIIAMPEYTVSQLVVREIHGLYPVSVPFAWKYAIDLSGNSAEDNLETGQSNLFWALQHNEGLRSANCSLIHWILPNRRG